MSKNTTENPNIMVMKLKDLMLQSNFKIGRTKGKIVNEHTTRRTTHFEHKTTQTKIKIEVTRLRGIIQAVRIISPDDFINISWGDNVTNKVQKFLLGAL